MSRKYVDVICLNDQLGNIKPLFIIWNNEKKIPIIKIKDVCQRSALKSGGSGLRYTCVFEHKLIRHLYYDRGKWFVEMNDNLI